MSLTSDQRCVADIASGTRGNVAEVETAPHTETTAASTEEEEEKTHQC